MLSIVVLHISINTTKAIEICLQTKRMVKPKSEHIFSICFPFSVLFCLQKTAEIFFVSFLQYFRLYIETVTNIKSNNKSQTWNEMCFTWLHVMCKRQKCYFKCKENKNRHFQTMHFNVRCHEHRLWNSVSQIMPAKSAILSYYYGSANRTLPTECVLYWKFIFTIMKWEIEKNHLLARVVYDILIPMRSWHAIRTS